jgi:hypothetical protein
VDPEPPLRSGPIPDGESPVGASLDDRVLVLEVGADRIDPYAEQPVGGDKRTGPPYFPVRRRLVPMLQDLNRDHDRIPSAHGQRREVTADQSGGPFGRSLPQLGDRYRGNVQSE